MCAPALLSWKNSTVARDNKGKAEAAPIIVVRRGKKHGHEHHGGSWKVALADFMTAMMAFFLLLYLLEAATPKELAAIAGYFQNPGYKYNVGPGGADASVVELKSPMEESAEREVGQEMPKELHGVMGDEQDVFAEESEKEEEEIPSDHEESLEVETMSRQVERAHLETLESQLRAEIATAESALHVLSEQIQLEFTDLGLSIQIVDKERRPMFAEGSARLRDYAEEALYALAPIIGRVPNGISIIGHTDAKSYGPGSAYSNWELSADRANSARRALLAGAYPEGRVVSVQGMGSRSPLIEDNPLDPANRRIAIVVLKKTVQEAMLEVDTGGLPATSSPADPKAREAPSKPMTDSEVDAAIESEYSKE